MKINPALSVRKVFGEDVVLIPGLASHKHSSLLVLNKTSCFLWQQLKDKSFVEDDVVNILIDHFDVEEATARADAKKWIATLNDNHALSLC